MSAWSTDRFQFLETGSMVGTACRHLLNESLVGEERERERRKTKGRVKSLDHMI